MSERAERRRLERTLGKKRAKGKKGKREEIRAGITKPERFEALAKGGFVVPDGWSDGIVLPEDGDAV